MTDEDNFAANNKTRRELLRTTGVTLAGLVGSTGVGGAATEHGEPAPTKAEATVIKRFRPDGEQYRMEKRTVSPAFKERFGGPTITYEPEPVPREFVPDEHTDPDRPFTVQYRDEVIVGTLADHQAAEQKSHNGRRFRFLSHTQSYDGPRYVYESASGAEDQDLYERTAPINVGWGVSINRSASQLQSYMEDRGWQEHWTLPGSSSRYILYNGEAHAQDEHIYKEIYFTRQWHIRAYDVSADSSVESIQVVGNVHRDPLDHNIIGNDPWYFNDARDEASGDWESWGNNSESVYSGWSLWDTDDGNMDIIYSDDQL